MTKSKLEDVVRVHLESFHGFFLTFLGESFLEVYYKGVIESRDSIKLVCTIDNAVVGFVTGSPNPSYFYSSMIRKYWLELCCASMSPLIRRPTTMIRLLQTLMRSSSKPEDPEVAELSSLCVLPDFQNRGLGQQLVSAFLAKVRDGNGKAVYLTTDAEVNDSVNNFYQNLGFTIKESFKAPGKRQMNLYWLDLRTDRGSIPFNACEHP